MLAERVRMLAAAPHDDSSLWPPLWPPQLPREPFPSSWKHVLAAALPHLLRDGLLESFLDLLAARSGPAEQYVADHAFLTGMLEHFQNRKDWERHAQVAQVIRASAGFDDKAKKNITRREERVELQRDEAVEGARAARRAGDRRCAPCIRAGWAGAVL